MCNKRLGETNGTRRHDGEPTSFGHRAGARPSGVVGKQERGRLEIDGSTYKYVTRQTTGNGVREGSFLSRDRSFK